jgi:hypothetical protein
MKQRMVMRNYQLDLSNQEKEMKQEKIQMMKIKVKIAMNQQKVKQEKDPMFQVKNNLKSTAKLGKIPVALTINATSGQVRANVKLMPTI